MKTYMHDERYRVEEGWAMGRPPRPIEPDYDNDGEPIFDDGKLGDGMDFGRIYEPHTFAGSSEECGRLSEVTERRRQQRIAKHGRMARIDDLADAEVQEMEPVEAVRIVDIHNPHEHPKVKTPREWRWLKGQDWYLGGAKGSYFIAFVRPDEYEPEEPLRGEDGEPARFGSREEATEAAEAAAGYEDEYRVEYVEP